jgi:acetyl-CoA acetyltransferase family protein
MSYSKVFIPYGCYWSTPFCKWQGSYSSQHPIKFAAQITQRALEERGIPAETFDSSCLGWTVPSQHSFYGGPWFAALAGAGGITGPIISQACATGVKCTEYGGSEVELGRSEVFLAVTADKCSNGAHLYYPNPLGPGGQGDKEDWVMDNFGFDPSPGAGKAMFMTAENVAKEEGITREEQDEVALLRYEQYQNALANDRAFQKKYMVTPIEVKDARGRKTLATVETDEGVMPSTAEGLAKLRPVMRDGTVTFGTQTFPADGNAGVVLATQEKAAELSKDKNVVIQLVATAQSRVKPGFMPAANEPAVRLVLERAGIGITDIKAITTHTPFAVNDVFLAKKFGLKPEFANRYGCSLVWGHPQGPTGMRSIIELIEELAELGGGYGLFTGCAAGDTAAALVLKVTVA